MGCITNMGHVIFKPQIPGGVVGRCMGIESRTVWDAEYFRRVSHAFEIGVGVTCHKMSQNVTYFAYFRKSGGER